MRALRVKINLSFGVPAFLLMLSLAASGCVSRSQARMQAHLAYLAGQREAFMHMQQQQSRGPSVMFIGAVKTPVVGWTQGLTLSQAIVTAVYSSPANPTVIVIRRGQEAIPVDPDRLLEGEDHPLQAGDIIEIRP
jgi:hypothetical protein